MVDPDKARAWIEHHFDTVTTDEFIANVRRLDPDFAEELWGAPQVAVNAAPASPGAQMARATLKEDHPTAAQQIVDDFGRHTPELAPQLGVAPLNTRVQAMHRGPRGFFASLGRSVLRLFS